MMLISRRAALAAIFSVAAAGVSLQAPSASALEPDAAKTFVSSVAERLVALIRAEQPLSEKRTAFRDLMNESAAMPQIARYALGAPWRKMDDQQKAEYLQLFPEYLSKIYTKRFNDYKGETMKVVDAQDKGNKGVYVNTLIERPGAEPFKVVWRVQDKAGPIQITDINVEGVSLLITQREDFQGQLEQSGGDIAKFLDRLRSLSAG